MDQRPLCQRACLHPECSARRRAAKAVSTESATVAPVVKLEPMALKAPDLRDPRVRHATKKDATAAVRRARWRKKNPEQHRVQQRAARARRKGQAS
jgi:hypothetical protein